MALRIAEFFGYAPLDPAAEPYVSTLTCPFVGEDCIKPKHGSCSVQPLKSASPVICCANRLYDDNFRILSDVAQEAFGSGCQLVKPSQFQNLRETNTLTGNQVVVFGRYWGRELPLPRPPKAGSSAKRQYYVDWILARVGTDGTLKELTAIEVQTIDTTGSYRDQSRSFFSRSPYKDIQERSPGYSNAGMNWENVNKRILPQIIYKGHVLRREVKCTKGLFFVCPSEVYQRIQERLGSNLHEYPIAQGTITFRSYDLGPEVPAGNRRNLQFSGQFTTTVDQVALAFTSPMNLPDQNVYEAAISNALTL